MTAHSRRSRLQSIGFTIAPPAILILAIKLLLRFPQEQFAFYPQCPIHLYLHLDCPGCGTTRALTALLRGHLLQALHFNALTTLLLPVAFVYVGVCYIQLLRRQPISLPQPSTRAIQIALAVTTVFTIVRNL